jgi:hypothetical protein
MEQVIGLDYHYLIEVKVRKGKSIKPNRTIRKL